METNEKVLVDANNDSLESGKLVLMAEEVKPKEREVVIKVKLDQKGLKNKDNELVDPDNNTFKEITVTATGKVINIARIAGRVAQDLHQFHKSIAGKGINRAVGFNINLEVSDTASDENGEVKYESISKVRMSNPIDVAFKIMGALLTQCEEFNAEALLTGDFRMSEEGRLLLAKMNMDSSLEGLPLHIFEKKSDERRKDINRNVRENAKFLN